MKPKFKQFQIGKHIFDVHFFFAVDHYKATITTKEVDAFIKQNGFEDDLFGRIKAVRRLTQWGLAQSKLWVELHYPPQ